jgi:hypothetical protein
MTEKNVLKEGIVSYDICLLFLSNALEIFHYQGSVYASDVDVLNSDKRSVFIT